MPRRRRFLNDDCRAPRCLETRVIGDVYCKYKECEKSCRKMIINAQNTSKLRASVLSMRSTRVTNCKRAKHDFKQYCKTHMTQKFQHDYDIVTHMIAGSYQKYQAFRGFTLLLLLTRSGWIDNMTLVLHKKTMPTNVKRIDFPNNFNCT